MKKTAFKKIVWFLVTTMLLLSIAPNIFPNYWFIDIFANFKVQYLIFSFLLLVICSISLKRKIIPLILLLIAITWNAFYIVPYYFNSTEAKKTSAQFKISSINLLSTNSETASVKKYLEKENPDILILLEFTPRWEKELSSMLENYSYKQIVAQNDNFGIALLSKFKMKSSVDYFQLNDKPSIIGNITIHQQEFSVIATHPVPPVNQREFTDRNLQLTNIVKRRAQFSENLIIAGDFNNSSFSTHFSNLLKGDLKDSRKGFGLLPSWPANFGILQTTLDHFLVSKNIQVLDRSTGENTGSDHLPITMVVGLE
ncbi:endonuclease/exonuclease/phosphatase family protein [Mesonia maritima]|uniref:Endonuclease/exonuclease/phosphatase (EEP) superfamily protein YafD n=1 Tax=Mesonia maritima TaxID=1793873 RepID=A0ABU1K328_9FLAO|nr:endonuclease/exonuclease/phosphatase family protein [Mesonia maritima]MDR6300019.1 endonuclease/exonuclease/phosphatase (EEP) superfamily protein YafD [Mesonia maritima]